MPAVAGWNGLRLSKRQCRHMIATPTTAHNDTGTRTMDVPRITSSLPSPSMSARVGSE